MSQFTTASATPVLTLELDRSGSLTKKTMKLDQESQLTNSLLQGLYPGIRVARVDVPTEPLDACEQAIVEQALTRIEVDGIRYSLVGASGSAKNGKFYAVDSSFEKKLGERFRFSPQAAITYFGILVSSCKVITEEADCRILVVDDHELGTNDCRGWISASLFRKLKRKHESELLAEEVARLLEKRMEESTEFPIPLAADEAEDTKVIEEAKRRIHGKTIGTHRFYQFRLAFDRTQAKGAFKIMTDDVAQHLDADIILPKSCVKPTYRGGVLRTLRSFIGDRQAHTFRGPVLVGFRDVSRNLEFNSSYTLLEHAPDDSIELEIKPYALSQIGKVRQAFEENNFAELFQLLGTELCQRILEPGEEPDPDYTSSEYSVAQATLIADATGYMLKHPFIQHHLQRVLAKWAYRLCTSGGFRLPGFALADDGYLCLHERSLISGSDWIPKTTVIAQSECRRGLVVRYPIRMKEDLLPVTNLSEDDLEGLLIEHLAQAGCSLAPGRVAAVVREQLQLKGTLILHSETASRNGGDFDFDMVCMVEDHRFPRFVEDRFAYEEQHAAVKNKNPKPPSPWWNLPQVAMQARGNQIGAITDLKTSCLAKGRLDLAQELVDQLQNALDQLKHGTQPDQEVIRNIRNDVPTAPWLKLKQRRRIEDMDEHLEVDANDKVGRLYNFVRKELGRYFGATMTAPLSDFRGVIGGQSFTPEIYQECFVVNRYYGSRVTEIMGRREQLLLELEKANAEIEAHKQDPEARKELFFRRNQATAALHAYDKRAGDELKALVQALQKWSSSKNGTRLSYLSALHAIVCRERRMVSDPNFVAGTGSIVFYSFPQEVVDQIAERTGGRPVTVEIPSLCDGEVEVDGEGRIFLVQPFTQASGQIVERLIFVAQVNKSGEVFTDRDEQGSPIIRERVRPFPIQAGRSEIRDGKVIFPETRQRPQLPTRSCVSLVETS
ncbi:MAG TPA: hypothetical protein VN577_01615 [Terriglobales bacterium]|nr:hypothetical protein [Terriglobales bacterium]